MDRLKLNKDLSILNLLLYLGNRFGVDKFIINDYWDADLCSIGLSDPQKKVIIYISTYNKKKGQYYISIENNDDSSILIEESDNIGVTELEARFGKHIN